MLFLTDGKRHLICVPYSIENLHRMAEELGIGRHWFHSGSLAHYDIPKRRMKEIAERCVIVSSREIVKVIKETNEDTTHDCCNSLVVEHLLGK